MFISRYTVNDLAYGLTLCTRTYVETPSNYQFWLIDEAHRRRDWSNILEDLAVCESLYRRMQPASLRASRTCSE